MNRRPWGLSRSHLRVLEHFWEFPQERHSTRRTAKVLSFSCSTVQLAIDTLNAKELIRTIGGSRTEASVHVVAPEVTLVLGRCTDFGAGRVPISAHPVPVAGVPISAHLPAATHANSPVATRRIKETRGALTHSQTQTTEGKLESECSEEVSAVTAAIGELVGAVPFEYESRRAGDKRAVAGQITALLASVGAGPRELRDYLEDLVHGRKYRIYHPGALLAFVRQDLPRLVPRKPPRRAETVWPPEMAEVEAAETYWASPDDLRREIENLELGLRHTPDLSDICRAFVADQISKAKAELALAENRLHTQPYTQTQAVSA